MAMLETLPGVPADLSEQWVYGQTKLGVFIAAPHAKYIEGTELKNYLDTLRLIGVVPEAFMPYNPKAGIWTDEAPTRERFEKDLAGARLFDLLSFAKLSWKIPTEALAFQQHVEDRAFRLAGQFRRAPRQFLEGLLLARGLERGDHGRRRHEVGDEHGGMGFLSGIWRRGDPGVASLRRPVEWVAAALKDVPAAQHAGFQGMFAPVRNCQDVSRLIDALRLLPTVTESGTHFVAGGGAHEITSARWQRELQAVVLALR
jgi:hypothetical protein